MIDEQFPAAKIFQPSQKIGGRVKLSSLAYAMLQEASKVRGGQTRIIEQSLEYMARMQQYGASEIHSDVIQMKENIQALTIAVQNALARGDELNAEYQATKNPTIPIGREG